jgi:Protein of unknown function (DUF1403)
MQSYRTSAQQDKRGGLFAYTIDKAPRTTHHREVIRPDLALVPDPIADLGEAVPALGVRKARTKAHSPKAPELRTSSPPAAVPAWARATGRAGESDPHFFAGVSLALLDAHLCRDPPAAGALRSRLALQSAAASARILRLNTEASALRDLRFTATAEPLPSAKLLELWRDLTRRPPSLDARRVANAAGLLDCPVAAADALAESLSEQSRAGDPASAAAKVATLIFAAVPDALAAEAEILALWAFDLVLALQLRWPRPVPLIATKLLDPGLTSYGGGRRSRPGEPGWEHAAVAAIALAAAAALDLAADLARRADILLAIAPKLRAKPAQKIVDLMLAQDCVAPAEAARHAPMTDRAARRLFDRLVALGAAREISGRPAFRLFGL